MATMAIYLSCSIALVIMYMHKIKQTTIGMKYVICQNSVSCEDCSDETTNSLAAAVASSHRRQQCTTRTDIAYKN